MPSCAICRSSFEGGGNSSVANDWFRAQLVPCTDGAGEVVAVGADVKRWRTGGALCGYTDGIRRKYINVLAYSIVPVPDHLSHEEASTLLQVLHRV